MPDNTIFRRAKNQENPYVMVARDIFEDATLSFKAKGLMGYLLSRPDNWEVRMGDLVRRSTDGIHAVRTALVELEQHGYLTRYRERDQNGQFVRYVVEVHEIPVPEDQRTEPETRPREPSSPQSGFPQMDNPIVENPKEENRTITNKDLTNKDPTKEPAAAAAPSSPSAKKDYLEHCAEIHARTKGEKSWTVPEDAGGKDPFEDKPLLGFCALVRTSAENLPEKRRLDWTRALRKLAESWLATPDELYNAIRAIPDSEYHWMTFASPHQGTFMEVVSVILGRIRGGLPVGDSKKGNGNANDGSDSGTPAQTGTGDLDAWSAAFAEAVERRSHGVRPEIEQGMPVLQEIASPGSG